MTAANFMERLHRLERLYIDNPVDFATLCAENRKPILVHKASLDAFVQFCQEALKRNILVGRYILMPDHLLLLVKLPPPSKNLSHWVKSLKKCLSKVLRSCNVSAPRWEKRFLDHVVRSTDSYSQTWPYLVENSVRAGLTAEWARWPLQGEIYPLRLGESLRRSQAAAT